MRKRTSRGIQRAKKEDHKSTHTHSTEKRRKIPSKNRYFRTYYKRSSIPRARRKIETYCIFVKNDVTSRKKLQDLWQRTTHSSKSPYKVEVIPTGHHREV